MICDVNLISIRELFILLRQLLLLANVRFSYSLFLKLNYKNTFGRYTDVNSIDHIVLNCKDVEYTANWYERVLRLKREVFGPESTALKFGNQKINLRPIGAKNWITSKNEWKDQLIFVLLLVKIFL